MSVVVTGASNQVAAFLIPKLLASGAQVNAIARQEQPPWIRDHARLRWHTANLEKPHALLTATCLVHLAPLALAPAMMAKIIGLRSVVAASSTSVHSKRDSTEPGERRLVASLVRGEADLIRQAEALSLRWQILRPTIIYGAGLDRGLTRIADLLRRWRGFALVGGAGGLRQPIHAEDVAHVIIAALQSPGNEAFDICGGSTISYRKMVVRIFRSLSLSPRFLTVPTGLARAMIPVMHVLPGMRDINRAMLERMNRDLAFDDSPARQALAHRPRPFQPNANCWTRLDLRVPGNGKLTNP